MRNAALGAAAAAALLALAGAAVPAISAEQAAKPLAEADARFLAQAIRDGEAEVEMGKTAERKASAAEVKRFAERMVQDHGEMGKKLADLAGKRKIDVKGTYGPPQMQAADAKAKAAQRAMEEKSGRDFDRAYVAAAVEGHEKAVGVFEEGAGKGEDAEVRGLASAALPTIREHLEMARALAKQVGAASR